jgi:hypothetical protein
MPPLCGPWTIGQEAWCRAVGPIEPDRESSSVAKPREPLPSHKCKDPETTQHWKFEQITKNTYASIREKHIFQLFAFFYCHDIFILADLVALDIFNRIGH